MIGFGLGRCIVKIDCLNGFYKFTPENPLDLSRLKIVFGIELVPYDDYFTFSILRDMDNFSIVGFPVMSGIIPSAGIAKKNFAGKKWEVLKENNLIYNLRLNAITEQSVAVGTYTLTKSIGNYYAFDKIPQTGSLLNGTLFTSFSAIIDFDFRLVYVKAIW
jgi:hypothetical protein